MKKFLKIIGFLLAMPIKFLMIMYSIPLFLLDYLVNLLIKGSVKHSKITKFYKLCKFGMKNLWNGKTVTLASTLKAYTDTEKLEYTQKDVFCCK